MNEPQIDTTLLTKTSLEALKTAAETLTRQAGDYIREKNLWTAKLITVASAVLAGFFLARYPDNLVTRLGVSLALVVVVAGLLFTYRATRRYLDAIIESFGDSADYNIRLLLYLDLLNRPTLSPQEQELKRQIETYLAQAFRKMGLLKDDGSLGSVRDKLMEKSPLDWPNYFLILGFFLSGIILTFSSYFEDLLGLGN